MHIILFNNDISFPQPKPIEAISPPKVREIAEIDNTTDIDLSASGSNNRIS